MALQGIDLAATKDITLEEDGAEDPTIFVLASLDYFTMTSLQGKLAKTAQSISPNLDNIDRLEAMSDIMVEFIRYGISDIRNFRVRGETLAPIFEDVSIGRRKYKMLSEDTIRHFQLEHIGKIFDEILVFNQLGEEPEKNLESQSGSPNTAS